MSMDAEKGDNVKKREKLTNDKKKVLPIISWLFSVLNRKKHTLSNR